jgi:hypothetical protein
MLATAYLAIAAAPVVPPASIAALFLMPYLVAAASIAAFGHVYHDAFDIEEDRIHGKENLWAPLGNVSRALLILALSAGSILPWLLFPGRSIPVALLAAELAMFILYATPPFRLKERGLPGAVADALYAHTLPALWTWVPFAALYGSTLPRWFPFVLGTWAFAVGMRHILQHQMMQHDADAAANARTFVVRHGTRATASWLAGALLPAEIVGFVVLLFVMAPVTPFLGAVFAIYVSWQAVKFRYLWSARFAIFGTVPDADRVSLVGTLVLSRFYERWLPVLILASLAAVRREYLIFLAVHVLAFRQGLRELRQDARLVAPFVRPVA